MHLRKKVLKGCMMGNIFFFYMSQASKIRKKCVLLLVNKHSWYIQDTTVPSNMQFMNNRIQELKEGLFYVVYHILYKSGQPNISGWVGLPHPLISMVL